MTQDENTFPITHHPELYFPDGSVVLLCPTETETRVAFKVFKSLLAANSEIFHDALAMEQPREEEIYDGCPVITCYDDPTDMECLLKATMFPQYALLYRILFESERSLVRFHSYIPNHGPPPTWKAFFAVLRLSAKYNFHGLQRGILHHLETAFPFSYDDYRARQNSNKLGLRYWDVEPTPSNMFQLINFIRGCHAVHCLPYAFYEACQLFAGDTITEQLEGESPLSHADFRAVILGATALQNDEMELMRYLFSTKPMDCVCARMGSEERTQAAVKGVCFAMWCGMPTTVKTSTSPLLDTALKSFMPNADIAFCDACWNGWDQGWKVGKQKMWEKLPDYFSLPHWNVLLRDRRTVE